MNNLHDNEIISYEVNLKNKYINLHTLNRTKNIYSDVIFNNVLIYSFKDEFQGSIIFEIIEYSIDKFLNEYNNLKIYQNETFHLTDYQDKVKFLVEHEQFFYYTISASYGLYGFIIAKNRKVETIDDRAFSS